MTLVRYLEGFNHLIHDFSASNPMHGMIRTRRILEWWPGRRFLLARPWKESLYMYRFVESEEQAQYSDASIMDYE